MIAAVIGEELGLIGILATALAFAALRGARLPDRHALRDPFGKYLAAGITAWSPARRSSTSARCSGSCR